MWLWLKKSAVRPAGSRSARRRDPTRRRALPPRRRALPPPPSGPAAATLRGLRLELLADGRLQRARFRRLRMPTRGICRRVTSVSVRRLAAFRPAGSRRSSFCTSPRLFTTASRAPLTSSTLNVIQEMCLRCFGGYEGRLSPGRTIPSASRSARPRPAAPPCAPTRPARGMSGFWTRQVQIYISRCLEGAMSIVVFLFQFDRIRLALSPRRAQLCYNPAIYADFRMNRRIRLSLLFFKMIYSRTCLA